MDPETEPDPETYHWHLPSPSPRAERVLLTLYAMGAVDGHRVQRLAETARSIGIEADLLPALLDELVGLGYVHLSPRGRVARLTLAAAEHIGHLASEVLRPEATAGWSPLEKAEALLILRPERFYAELLIH